MSADELQLASQVPRGLAELLGLPLPPRLRVAPITFPVVDLLRMGLAKWRRSLFSHVLNTAPAGVVDSEIHVSPKEGRSWLLTGVAATVMEEGGTHADWFDAPRTVDLLRVIVKGAGAIGQAEETDAVASFNGFTGGGVFTGPEAVGDPLGSDEHELARAAAAEGRVVWEGKMLVEGNPGTVVADMVSHVSAQYTRTAGLGEDDRFSLILHYLDVPLGVLPTW